MALFSTMLFIVVSFLYIGITAAFIDSTDSPTTILWWTAAAPFHRLRGCFHLKHTRDRSCEEYCELKGEHYGFCSDFVCSCLNKFNAGEYDLDSILKQPAPMKFLDKLLATVKPSAYLPGSNSDTNRSFPKSSYEIIGVQKTRNETNE